MESQASDDHAASIRRDGERVHHVDRYSAAQLAEHYLWDADFQLYRPRCRVLDTCICLCCMQKICAVLVWPRGPTTQRVTIIRGFGVRRDSWQFLQTIVLRFAARDSPTIPAQREPSEAIDARTLVHIYPSVPKTHDHVYNGDKRPSSTSCSLICFTVSTARSQILFACATVQTAGGASIRQSPPPSILSAGIPSVEIPFSKASACIRCAIRGAKVSCPGHATSIAQKTPAPLMSTTKPPSPSFSSSSERLYVSWKYCDRTETHKCVPICSSSLSILPSNPFSTRYFCAARAPAHEVPKAV